MARSRTIKFNPGKTLFTSNMETIKLDSCIIEINQDEIYLNPRKEFDCFPGTFVCFHPRYDFGDINPRCSPDEYKLQMMQDRECSLNKKWVPDDINKDHVEAYIAKHFVMLPVYAYEHGDICIKVKPFGCRWDSGQVGFIYICRYSKEYDDLEAGLTGEIEVFNEFLQGNVYSFSIYDLDGEILESSGGCYGIDHCKQEALHIASRFNQKPESPPSNFFLNVGNRVWSKMRKFAFCTLLIASSPFVASFLTAKYVEFIENRLEAVQCDGIQRIYGSKSFC